MVYRGEGVTHTVGLGQTPLHQAPKAERPTIPGGALALLCRKFPNFRPVFFKENA